jgi:hypothetical protein
MKNLKQFEIITIHRNFKLLDELELCQGGKCDPMCS